MQNKNELDSLTQVRAACHQVSVQFDHDPWQLVERYMQLQEGYKDRFVSSEKKEEFKMSKTLKLFPCIYLVVMVFCSLLYPVELLAQDKASKINELITKTHDSLQFNGSVLVAEKGEIIYKKSFG